MFKWLSNVLKFLRREHECEFIVVGVMEASTDKEKTLYGIAMCRHFFCNKKIYFPEEYRLIHEKWIKEGKNIVLNFERNIYANLD